MSHTSASLEEDDGDDDMNDYYHRSRTSSSESDDVDVVSRLIGDTNRNNDVEIEEEEEEEEEGEEAEGEEGEEEEEEEGEEEEEEEGEEYQGEQEAEMEELNGVGDDKEEDCSSSKAALTVILKDPDVLDCPICFLPLTIPVFQCKNGHIACSSCCCQIKNVCPSCSLSIGNNRCRAIENVLESIKIQCTNIKYGCKETTSYNKKHEHELMCIYEPCSCPHRGCDFVASSKVLYSHYSSTHTHSAISFKYTMSFAVPVKNGMDYVVLRERTDQTLFVLDYAVQSIGNVASITCISPSSAKKGFSYELFARKGDSKIKLESFTECMPRWSKYIPHGEFLLVPSAFPDRHNLIARIWRR